MSDTAKIIYNGKVVGADNPLPVRIAAGSIAASAVTVTPTGGITSTDVQSALAELDSEISSISRPSALTNNLGSWNAATNTPTITSGTGNAGDWYTVNVSGTTNIDDIAVWGVGDYIWFDSSTTTWQKIDNSAGVSNAPGGITTNVQYNDSGNFAGSTSFTWNNTTKRLSVNRATAAAPLHVEATASGVNEIIQRWSVSDDAGSYLEARNGLASTSPSRFNPCLYGLSSNTGDPCVTIWGGLPGQTGTTPAVLIKADYNGAATTSRPILAIRNHTTTHATFDYTGNLGIGTTSPERLLDVSKSTNSGANATFPAVRTINTLTTQGDGTSTYNFAGFEASSGNGVVSGSFATSYASDSVYSNSLRLGTTTNHPIQFLVNNSEVMRLTTGGNLGVGIANTAGNKFYVNGGNAYFSNDVSALSFTDRTPYPKDYQTAIDAIMSMEKLPDGEYKEDDKEHQLNHEKLHPYVKSGDFRDMSATVSCLVEVVKQQQKEIQELKACMK